MKIFTVRKKRMLTGIMFVCLVWLAWFSFYPNDSSSNNDSQSNISESGESIDGSGKNESQAAAALNPQDFEIVPEMSRMEAFFVNYRIEREKVRSQQMEILREIINNPQSANTAREKAQDRLMALTETLENELKVENLLLAKQYQDAAVFIQPDSVMVVVKGDIVNETDTIKIADLVSNTTGHPYEEIIITTKN